MRLTKILVLLFLALVMGCSFDFGSSSSENGGDGGNDGGFPNLPKNMFVLTRSEVLICDGVKCTPQIMTYFYEYILSYMQYKLSVQTDMYNGETYLGSNLSVVTFSPELYCTDTKPFSMDTLITTCYQTNHVESENTTSTVTQPTESLQEWVSKDYPLQNQLFPRGPVCETMYSSGQIMYDCVDMVVENTPDGGVIYSYKMIFYSNGQPGAIYYYKEYFQKWN